SLWKVMFYGGIGQKELVAQSNIQTIIGNSWLALVSLLLAFILVRAFSYSKIKENVLIGILAVFIGLDYFRIDKNFIKTTSIEAHYPRSELVEYLLAERAKEPFRVLILPNTLPDNYLATFGIEEVSFTAMHGNHLRLYDEFVGRHEQTPNLIYPKFWDILNVKFVISSTPYDFPFLKEIRKFGGLILYENLGYIPRAYTFFKYEVLPHNKVLERLKDQTFPYREVIILEEHPDITLEEQIDTLTQISIPLIKENKINSFVVEINMERNGLLFLSENYYPAWRCYENGKERKILVADYTFRAVPLEKGFHRLTFKYFEPTVNASFRISIGTAIFSIILLALSIMFARKQNLKVKQQGK
ncbi:MAG: YfhO family protein, partial [bacterium]